ncbi:MAG TPA: enoyl-CoA hydratase/isomerase family protein [Pyrinomonadaceae bacterium]|jgi:enoyl-CoA hydratase/carnithine racemase|nr:enoyl-CoA hydratase/isomerase family protein [Pyrinomonadaceae bacterium]
MSNAIQHIRNGDALVIRFTAPEARNPLSRLVLEEISRCLDAVDGVNKVIFTGVDGVFASGADLREIANVTPEQAGGFAQRGQSLMSQIADLEQTTIAAVNGYCFGGALDLALACDRRIASPNATFAHPGAGLGIITGWGGTQRLPRLVGTANALEMFFTAAPIDARRALAIKLVDEIVDDPLEAALAVDSDSLKS